MSQNVSASMQSPLPPTRKSMRHPRFQCCNRMHQLPDVIWHQFATQHFLNGESSQVLLQRRCLTNFAIVKHVSERQSGDCECQRSAPAPLPRRNRRRCRRCTWMRMFCEMRGGSLLLALLGLLDQMQRIIFRQLRVRCHVLQARGLHCSGGVVGVHPPLHRPVIGR